MSFGENLRRERELRGISLHEIAEATKISARFLQALEQDRLDVLPGGIFPRAFLKQYARYLGLDPEKVAAEFQYLHAEALPEKWPAPRPPRWSPPPGALFLGALAAAAAVLLFSYRRSASGPPVRAEQAPAASVPAVLPSDRVYPPPRPAGPPAAVSEGLVLTLTAQQSCWVEVRADGQTVINRVLNEGETETLAAQGELVLSVGNAGGVPLGRTGEVRRNIVITKDNLPSLVQDAASAAAAHSS